MEPQVLQASNCPSLKTSADPLTLLPDPTTAASERAPGHRRCGESTCLFQCIEGCPQDESTQQRGAYGPLTLLPHKTRARHKKQAQVQTFSKTSLRGVEEAHASCREKDVHNMKASQDLCLAATTPPLHHSTTSHKCKSGRECGM